MAVEESMQASARFAIPTRPLQLAALATFAVMISWTRPLTAPAAMLVLAGGAAAIGAAAAWNGSNSGEYSLSLLWVALLLALCGWELAAFLLGDNAAHPTLSTIVDPAMSRGPTRSLAGFVWISAGWRLVIR